MRHLQAGIAHPRGDPLARANVRRGENAARPARAVGVAKLCQSFEVILNPPEIDGRQADQLPDPSPTARIRSTPMIFSTSASAMRSRVLEDSGSLSRWMWNTATSSPSFISEMVAASPVFTERVVITSGYVANLLAPLST